MEISWTMQNILRKNSKNNTKQWINYNQENASCKKFEDDDTQGTINKPLISDADF